MTHMDYFYATFIVLFGILSLYWKEKPEGKIRFDFCVYIPFKNHLRDVSLFVCSVFLTCSPPGTAGTHHILGSWNNIASLTLGTRTLLAGVGLLAVDIITFRAHLQIWYLISRVTASCKHNKSTFLSSGFFFFITETQTRINHWNNKPVSGSHVPPWQEQGSQGLRGPWPGKRLLYPVAQRSQNSPS